MRRLKAKSKENFYCQPRKRVTTLVRRWVFPTGLILLLTPLQAQAVLRMGTGPPQGTYHIVGNALRKAIARHEPQLEINLLQTNGSVENLEMIEQGQLDLALVQTDILRESYERALQTKRSPSYKVVLIVLEEPVQVVVGAHVAVDSLGSLSGYRIAYGPQGGGAYFTATRIAKTVGIRPRGEIKVNTWDDIYEALRSEEADAGFFITTIPTPQVAALLSIPRYKLIGLSNSEIQQMQKLAPEYTLVSIPERTYPLQSKPFVTLGIATALVCVPELDERIVAQITQAILRDVNSPDSELGMARQGVDFVSILSLNKERILPFHPGSERVLNQIPLLLRLRPYFEWVSWSFLVALLGGLWWLARRRTVRQRFFISFMKRIKAPYQLVAWISPLIHHKFAWAFISALSSLLIIWLLGSAYMYLGEHQANRYFISLKESMISILVYLFSGLEDRQPVTDIGWLGSLMMLITGVLVGAYITGQFVNYIQRFAKEGFQMCAQNAILIIGWNEGAESILNEIYKGFESGLPLHTVVVVTSPNTPQALITPLPSHLQNEAYYFSRATP